jgi:hypothetical protein
MKTGSSQSTYPPALKTTHTQTHDMLQGGMKTGSSQSTYPPALKTTYTQTHDMLPHH